MMKARMRRTDGSIGKAIGGGAFPAPLLRAPRLKGLLADLRRRYAGGGCQTFRFVVFDGETLRSIGQCHHFASSYAVRGGDLDEASNQLDTIERLVTDADRRGVGEQ